MTTVALVDDLMDRSKISAAIEDVTFVSSVDGCAGADLVVVDLARHAGDIAGVRSRAPAARIVAYGRHDHPGALAQAGADGADAALARSRFFHDPAAAVRP